MSRYKMKTQAGRVGSEMVNKEKQKMENERFIFLKNFFKDTRYFKTCKL